MGFCNCFMFCCAFLCFHYSLQSSQWGREIAGCFALFVFVWLFLTMQQMYLQFVKEVFSYHTQLLFDISECFNNSPHSVEVFALFEGNAFVQSI